MIDNETIVNLVPLMVVAYFIMLIVGPFITGGDRMVDRPKDVHQIVRKKWAKAARQSRPTQLRFLSVHGDRFYPPKRLGRIVGLAFAPEVTMVFYKPTALQMQRWLMVPTDLHGSVHVRELVVRANGVLPVGNFYEPAYPRDLSTARIRQYRRLIDETERLLVMREENVELVEQQANAEMIAVNARGSPGSLIRREDYTPTSAARGETDE